ncbi:unnamed protein product [Mytilus coruscus]|uniref:B box-type domain-containing protein n=1 Tax=Mytilus coruscus TaxID=42192 RepID=A0A6J8ESX8_MYTCO|nr:unnamed protein product [Mytilus coruscus]
MNHRTIPIEDYQKLPASVTDIKQGCRDHNRKFDFYCLFHNEPCCVSCVSEKHGNCQKLKSLQEVVEDVKSSASFTDLEDRVQDIRDLIDIMITEKQDNKESLRLQKNKMITEVQNVRKIIHNHLDKLQTDLLDKLENEEKNQSKSIDSFIEKLFEMHKHVEEIYNDLNKTKQHASDFQAFLCIYKWNQTIEKEEKHWMSWRTNQMMMS